MSYVQFRPPTRRILSAVISILKKNFFKQNDGISILDLFCGQGTFSLSVLKHFNVNYITCVDRDKKLTNFVQKRLDHMKSYNNYNFKYNVVCMDAFQFRYYRTFDILFIDPPFKFNMCTKILKNILKRKLLNKDSLIIMRNLNKQANQLKLDNKINILYNINIGLNNIIFLQLNSI